MSRHMVGTDGSRELDIPENSHDAEEIDFALIGINFLEIQEASTYVAHVNLVDLAALAEILHDSQDFLSGIFQSLRDGSQA